MNDPSDRYREWDAAYVMGALDPDDRRTFERHIGTCADCAAAVTELAGLPGLLGRLPVEDAVELLPESQEDPVRVPYLSGMVQRLAAEASRRRRRTRLRLTGSLLGAAAILIAGGVLLGTTMTPQVERVPTATTSGTVLTMEPVKPGTMTAELRVTEKGWGTRLDWSCEYSYPVGQAASDRSYELVLTDSLGAETVLASWTSASARSGDLAASSSVPTSQIRSVEIRSAHTDVPLVRTEL